MGGKVCKLLYFFFLLSAWINWKKKQNHAITVHHEISCL